MKKLMVFMIFCIPVYVWGDNAVFNDGFDMSPWDSGWTIETDTSYGGYSSAEVEVKPDSGKSLQNCCYLRTDCEIDAYPEGGYAEAEAKATITQNFDGITGCMIKAYLKWDRDSWTKGGPGTYGMMKACINNEWKLIWENASYTSTVETTWTEVCTTLVDDTLSGIRFHVESRFYNGYYSSWYWCHSYLWVDDIYVGEVGVEESEKSQVTSHKLQVYPNPFMQFTDVRCQMSDVRIQIYDMVGRLMEERSEKRGARIGKNLPAGIYFVKVKGYKPLKIIKLMGGL